MGGNGVDKCLSEVYGLSMRAKKEHGFAVTAFRVVQEATGQVQPKPKPTIDFKALGRLGGLNGGKARAASLSPERRVEIARKAALAKWDRQTIS